MTPFIPLGTCSLTSTDVMEEELTREKRIAALPSLFICLPSATSARVCVCFLSWSFLVAAFLV
ncbi:hypothetical protein CSUI_009933 [Cystoisospora suis]|uniref:Uncharacterized protein n=1 Tax=Cystoisospora suis TaxID=483139 RepID=A0A2C6KIN6_9APIC|nr:hypothetical protein CSUI_009933 [Cystoisospora suis]